MAALYPSLAVAARASASPLHSSCSSWLDYQTAYSSCLLQRRASGAAASTAGRRRTPPLTPPPSAAAAAAAATAAAPYHSRKQYDVVALSNLCLDIVVAVDALPPADEASRRQLLAQLTAEPPPQEQWEVGGECGRRRPVMLLRFFCNIALKLLQIRQTHCLSPTQTHTPHHLDHRPPTDPSPHLLQATPTS